MTPGQERLATHKVSGIKIYEIENPPVSRTDGGTSDIRGVTAPDIRLSGRPVAPSDDDDSRAEDGAYYEPREYNQIIDDMEIRYNEGIATRDMVTAEALVKEYAKARGYTLTF